MECNLERSGPTRDPPGGELHPSSREYRTAGADCPETVCRVSVNSKPGAVAGAVAGAVRSGERVSVHAVGSSAVYVAVKAIFTARSYLQPEGMDVACVPEFHVEKVGGKDYIVMVFNIIVSTFPGEIKSAVYENYSEYD